VDVLVKKGERGGEGKVKKRNAGRRGEEKKGKIFLIILYVTKKAGENMPSIKGKGEIKGE